MFVLDYLANRLRSLPLEEVAQNLGLQQHRYDKHKWKSEAHIISINDEKFYDHLASKGGGGAIDLVMHVLECDFQDAIAWLDGRSRYAIFEPNSRPPLRSRHTQKELVKAPACNIMDESKWFDVKQYLTQKRELPELLVESLHQQAIIAADFRRNAMFFRYGLDENFCRGEANGASLRGTEGDFKGLTPLTQRDAGYFWFQSGHGEVKRGALRNFSYCVEAWQKTQSQNLVTIFGLKMNTHNRVRQKLCQKEILVNQERAFGHRYCQE